MCVVLEQVEQEISKSNNLRSEVINLTSMIQSEKRKNNFCQEKNNFLQSEIESKNLTIKNKNSTIQENTVKATKKLEKQRVSYKEDRDNLLRYVIEQNEVANELSKTIQFMRAVISTSNPSPSLPPNTNTNADATLLSSSPSLSLSSPLPTIEDKDVLKEGEGRTTTSQQDIRIAHKTVFSSVENLDDFYTDINGMSKQGDNVRGEREEGDGEEGEGEGGGEEGEGEEEQGEEREVEGQLVRTESNEEIILKGGNEDEEDEKKKEKEVEEEEEEEEGRGGEEGGSDEAGIEESKAQLRSVMLRSK